MANQITDNRTLVYAFDSTASTVDLSGSAAGNLDSPPEAFIEGGASIGEITTNSRNGILFDAGSAQDWSSNVFYIWINCGVVGLLDTKANAGFTIRFCGATVTDWFEVYVGGSDSWPAAVQGGWVQFVIDIEDARAAAVVGTVGGTNGTNPATTAIRYVGWSAVNASVMTKMVDNTWIDAIWRLPDGSPGIIVEGRNGGSTDWNSADILTELGISAGMFIESAGGAYKIDAPIQFGINDTTTHGFTDTNAVWLWDAQEFAPSDLYSISALGNSGGTTRVNFGVKSGTGNDATGGQGLVIAAASTGVRWGMDFDDPNIDDIGFWGCSFQHFGTFEWDDAAVDVASTLLIDGTLANVSNASIVRAAVINPNTADGSAFMVTDDMGDIAHSSFEFTDGHAIELNAATPTSQNNIGNTFSGFTNTINSTDAAILNSAAGSLTISSSGGSDLLTDSYRNTGGGSIAIESNVSVTFTGLKDNSEVRIYTAGTNTELAGIEDATAGSVDNRTFSASISAATSVDYVIHNWQSGVTVYQSIRVNAFTWPSTDTTIQVQQQVDRNAV